MIMPYVHEDADNIPAPQLPEVNLIGASSYNTEQIMI